MIGTISGSMTSQGGIENILSNVRETGDTNVQVESQTNNTNSIRMSDSEILEQIRQLREVKE